MDIIIMGSQKSGKSSIKRVVFEKMSPHESVFNEPTTQIDSFPVDSLGYVKLSVTEFPGTFVYDKASPIDLNYFSTCGMVIYVVDSQETALPFDYFKDNVLPILIKHPDISLSIFTHKADSVNISQKDFSKQKGEINNRFKEIFTKNDTDINSSFYSTSIYDYSLFETFSKIFQKMMPQNANLSSLLDHLAINCKFEKAYLFDVFNKIYLAVDSSPVESQTYEICSDMIDVVLDMSGIYGDESNNDSYFDDNSASLIKINNTERNENSKSILYLRFIDSNLALISIVYEENFEWPHLLDYNIKIFRNAVKAILNK